MSEKTVYTREELLNLTGWSYPTLLDELKKNDIQGVRNPKHHGRFEYYLMGLRKSDRLAALLPEVQKSSPDEVKQVVENSGQQYPWMDKPEYHRFWDRLYSLVDLTSMPVHLLIEKSTKKQRKAAYNDVILGVKDMVIEARFIVESAISLGKLPKDCPVGDLQEQLLSCQDYLENLVDCRKQRKQLLNSVLERLNDLERSIAEINLGDHSHEN